MLTKQSKPFSITTAEGKTIEFSSGSEMALWARRNRPNWYSDSEKGIDYEKWEDEGSCTKEELEKRYEGTGIFQKNKKKPQEAKA